jgi:hypothetical protein
VPCFLSSGLLCVAFVVLLNALYPGDRTTPIAYACDDADCTCNGKTVCEVMLVVQKEMRRPLMLQFELDAFYQNHRRYVHSVSLKQLARDPASPPLGYKVSSTAVLWNAHAHSSLRTSWLAVSRQRLHAARLAQQQPQRATV